jgi:phosphoribosylaminoimidazolecarboxamide formyltransferase/IMP cyclohydrolase
VLAELQESGGEISVETRHWLANEAFAQTARYDAAISRWFGERYEVFPSHWVEAYEKFLDLSYGENPHQNAALYTEVGVRSHVLSKVSKLHGRQMSFNNVLDLDSARRLLAEFPEPACVIVKHNNPCGAAIADDVAGAYEKALACDPLSAYGGVIALNRPVDAKLAGRLHDNFIEVLIAPSYDEKSLETLKQKEAIRILEDAEQRAYIGERDFKRVRGGVLVQDPDWAVDTMTGMDVATKAEPDHKQWGDLLFAWAVARHVRSNAIVIAKDGGTIGIGAGQMSRIDSVRLAIDKAHHALEDAAEALKGSSLASDAFFPFPDGPQAAIDAGVSAFIQPGGSKRDAEVVAAVDEAEAAMVMTGRRHFRH